MIIIIITVIVITVIIIMMMMIIEAVQVEQDDRVSRWFAGTDSVFPRQKATGGESRKHKAAVSAF